MWSSRALTRAHLRDLGSAGDIEKFFSGFANLFVFPSDRSSLDARCSAFLLGGCLLFRSRSLARLCCRAPRLAFLLSMVFLVLAGLFLALSRTFFLPSLTRSVFLVLAATFLGVLKLRDQRASRAREARSFSLALVVSSQGPLTGSTSDLSRPKTQEMGGSRAAEAMSFCLAVTSSRALAGST